MPINHQFNHNQSNAVQKKVMSKGAKIVLGIICVFFGVPFLITFLSAFVNPNAQQNPSLFTAPTQSQTPPTVDNNSANKPKEVSKYKTKAERIKAGVIEMNDTQGNARPFSLTCWKQITEMDIFNEKRLTMGVKTAIFERCIELNGNAKQAVSEMAQLFKSR
jgi:hypothetical protein